MLNSPAQDKAISSVDTLSVWRMLMPACMLRLCTRLGPYGKPCDSPVSSKPSYAEDGMASTSPISIAPCTIPETMRSAVLFGPRDIRVIDRPVPRPGPGEVLVRVAMCGTCGSDLKIYDGHFPLTLPYGAFTPGHEWTGTVVALGETVDEFAVGDRVCIEAHHGCGRCDNCLIGKYTACLHYGNAKKGHRATGMTADGGFAEYVLHHVGSLYKIPPQVSFKDAVLITTAGTGLYGLGA